MKTSIKAFVCGLAVACAGLSVSACNTTKATYDSIIKFSSSTSPEDLFTADGLVKKDQKLNLYTAVVLENLQQDIARGKGEYLTSLAVLMDVPQISQEEFGMVAQTNYPILFASTIRSQMLSTVSRELGAHSKASTVSEDHR